MAQTKFSELTAAGALTGAEIVAVVQSGNSRRTTTQDIANLTPSGTVSSVNGETGAVTLSASDVGADPAGSAAAAQAASQPSDADLTAIAGLSPSNDDVLQRKAGAWTNRTIAQLKTDIGAASESADGVVELATAAETLTGTDNTRATHPAGVRATYANGLAATDTTGTAISFAVPQIYGSDGAPETGNITIVTTGLVKGMTQLLIHNNGSEPTYGAEIKIISGAYATGELNYIMLLAVSSTLVLVTISQEL